MVRIATRGSELALWQAHHVQSLLLHGGACDQVEIVIVSTSGDRDKTTPLAVIGGKGVFVKEVQAAVLDGRADVAVHSAKDMPAVSPDELVLGAVPERGDPRDALVGGRLADLAHGATVATGSSRRRAQLTALRPDLQFEELRGNIATRLGKAKHFDAIVMAAVALERLDQSPPVVDVIDVDRMIPQVGQGALAIECHRNDSTTVQALASISHEPSRRAFECERAFLRELGGDCTLPAGAHAQVDAAADAEFSLTGFLASEDLLEHHEMTIHGVDGQALGSQLAAELRARLALQR